MIWARLFTAALDRNCIRKIQCTNTQTMGGKKGCCFCLCALPKIKLYRRKREEESKKKGIEENLDENNAFLIKHRFCWCQMLIYKVKCRFLLEHHASIYSLWAWYFLCWILVQRIINLPAVRLIKILELIFLHYHLLKTISKSLKSTVDISVTGGPSVWLVHWKILLYVIKTLNLVHPSLKSNCICGERQTVTSK